MKRRILVMVVLCVGMMAGTGMAQMVGLDTGVGYTFDNETSDLNIVGNLTYVMPKDDFWDYGYGLDFQVQYWWEFLGVSLNLGVAQWQVNTSKELTATDQQEISYIEVTPGSAGGESTQTEVTETVDVNFSGKIDGDAVLFPLGFSFLARPFHTEKIRLDLETGLRLVFIDSNVDGRFSGEYEKNGRKYPFESKQEIDIDQAIVWIVAGDFSYAFNRTYSLNVGVGYQFDISKAEANWKNGTESIGGLSMEAAFIRLGLIYKY